MRYVKSEISKVFTLELTDVELGTIISCLPNASIKGVFEYAERKNLKILDDSDLRTLLRTLESLIVKY